MNYAPTKFALMIAVGLCALSVAVLVDASLLLPWAIGAGLLVAVLVLDGLLLRGVALQLSRTLPAEAGVGAPIAMTLTLASTGEATAAGALHDMLPPEFDAPRAPEPFLLAPGAQAQWRVPLTPRERGMFTLAPATALVHGPLRLMRRAVRLNAPAQLAAIPGIEILRDERMVLRAARDADAGATRARGVGRGGEFESLAPYVPGDPPQSVDWKAFARTGQLAVRRYVPERRRHIMLACDAGRLMGARVGGVRKLDLALQSLVKLAAAALHRGDLVGLMIFDGAVRAMIPPRAGGGQLARIVRASLGVTPSHTETAFTQAFVHMNHALGRRSLVVLATDFDNAAAGWELQRNIAQIRRRHLAIVAAMRDPVFHQILRAPVPDLDGAYRQLASLTLLEEREAILDQVHSMGVYVVDAEPDQLDVPLLNLYGRLVSGGQL